VQSIYENYAGTHTLGKGITASIAFSIISAVFNLFLMQRGVFIVGEKDSQSLGKDLLQIPRLVAEFIGFVPAQLWKMVQRGQFITVALIILMSGFLVGAMFGIFRGDWSWDYRHGSLAWAWRSGVVMIVLLSIGTILAGLTTKPSRNVSKNEY
jgi:hypothetical protein